MPFILTLFTLCKRHGIEQAMIKSLSYQDLVYLVIKLETIELEKYLEMKKKNNKDEVVYPDEKELTRFLYGGKLPKGKEVM